jgi:CRP-like cAMP-binding protein
MANRRDDLDLPPVRRSLPAPSTDEASEILKSSSFFAASEGAAIKQLASLAELVNLPSGDRLFDKGDVGTAMYFVVHGRVQMHNGEVVIGHLGPGAIFGEVAALCRSIERHAQRLDTVGAGAPGGHRAAANEDMVRVRELLAAMHIRLEAVDGLQLRLDALASGVGRLADAKLSERRTHRALTWAVALTAAAAMISLSLGLVSYFR